MIINTSYSMFFLNTFSKYNTGYALSGGGAKGFAHLGVLKALEERKLKPDIIAGTSAGALAGVLYADGFEPEEICEMFQNTKFKQFVEFGVPKTGLFRSTGLYNFLKRTLRSKSFEDLKIPFVAVATDWNEGKTVNFSEGDTLIDAVVASCCVPLVFSPIFINGVPYVDGGIFKNLPASTIRENCRVLFGINVTIIVPSKSKNNLKYVAERSFNLMSIANTLADKKLCDVLIEVEGVDRHGMFDLSSIKEIYERGYYCATKELNEKRSSTSIIKSKGLELMNILRY